MTRIRRILLATDFSKASQPAVNAALMLAKTHRASVTMLHVIVPITPMAPEEALAWAAWDDLAVRNQKWVRQQLESRPRTS